MTEAIALACTPNFSGAGRKRRIRAAQVMGVGAGALFIALVVVDAGAAVRALVGLPAAGAFISGLQVRRNTCVAHAATGSFEHEDFSVEKVDAARAAASKRVASTIVRDGALAGIAIGLVAALSAFIA